MEVEAYCTYDRLWTGDRVALVRALHVLGHRCLRCETQRRHAQIAAGGLRLTILVIIVIAVRTPQLGHALQSAQAYEADSTLMGLVGALLAALGVGLAIAARVQLGRNWGMPTTRKENPELVMTGPYAFVRHPIYGGMLIAMFGSAIGQSVFWVPPLILFGVYFIYSARHEEKLMIEQFPQQYPAYMARTKMLLPFI
jgi:protein-S-isoprenylcysteine O-methyltransferase Ste14